MITTLSAAVSRFTINVWSVESPLYDKRIFCSAIVSRQVDTADGTRRYRPPTRLYDRILHYCCIANVRNAIRQQVQMVFDANSGHIWVFHALRFDVRRLQHEPPNEKQVKHFKFHISHGAAAAVSPF